MAQLEQRACAYCKQPFLTRARSDQRNCSTSCGVRGRADIRKPKSQEMKDKISGPKHYRWVADRDALKSKQRFENRIRQMLNRTIRQAGTEKHGRALQELGYSWYEFKQRIESQFVDGMTWDNWGRGPGKWNIDHIKQVAHFSIGTAPSVINALSNLRPLWEHDNLSRPRKEAL